MIYVVSQKGDADYISIQEAVNSAPAEKNGPAVILLRMEEFCENVVIDRGNLRIIGEARRRTVLRSESGCTLTVNAPGVTIENLTLRGETAVTGAEKPAFYNCEINGECCTDNCARIPTWFFCGDESLSAIAEELESRPGDTYIQNCTKAGASTKSYVSNKLLGFTELCLRKGDALFVRFSRSDASGDIEYSTDAKTTFKRYLTMFIDAAEGQGAVPVLLSPANGGEYSEATEELSKMRGVIFFDADTTEQFLFCAGKAF